MPRRLFLAYRSAGILFALAAVVVAAASCAPLAGLFGSGDTTPRTKPVQDAAGFWHYSGETPLYQGARPVRLTNNPQATDPTWDALSAFILSDPTDAELYAPGLRVFRVRQHHP